MSKFVLRSPAELRPEPRKKFFNTNLDMSPLTSSTYATPVKVMLLGIEHALQHCLPSLHLYFLTNSASEPTAGGQHLLCTDAVAFSPSLLKWLYGARPIHDFGLLPLLLRCLLCMAWGFVTGETSTRAS